MVVKTHRPKSPSFGHQLLPSRGVREGIVEKLPLAIGRKVRLAVQRSTINTEWHRCFSWTVTLEPFNSMVKRRPPRTPSMKPALLWTCGAAP